MTTISMSVKWDMMTEVRMSIPEPGGGGMVSMGPLETSKLVCCQIHQLITVQELQ